MSRASTDAPAGWPPLLSPPSCLALATPPSPALDSPYSRGRPQRGWLSWPAGTAGAFGERVVCRVGPDSTWSQEPLSRWDPAHVPCHSFAEAFVMQLPLFWEQEGKEALKFSLTLAGFSFLFFFALWWVTEGSVSLLTWREGFSPHMNTSQPDGLCCADCSVPWPAWQRKVWETLLHGFCRNADFLF